MVWTRRGLPLTTRAAQRQPTFVGSSRSYRPPKVTFARPGRPRPPLPPLLQLRSLLRRPHPPPRRRRHAQGRLQGDPAKGCGSLVSLTSSASRLLHFCRGSLTTLNSFPESVLGGVGGGRCGGPRGAGGAGGAGPRRLSRFRACQLASLRRSAIEGLSEALIPFVHSRVFLASTFLQGMSLLFLPDGCSGTESVREREPSPMRESVVRKILVCSVCVIFFFSLTLL